MDKLTREVGNWVTGDRFWDRENELNNLIELLNEGANVLVTGQRRMGKTSPLQETARRLQQNGEYLCLYIDVQKFDSPAEVIANICIAIRPHLNLWNQAKEIFRNVSSSAINNIDTIAIDELTINLRTGLATSWQEKGDRIMDSLARSEKPVIIIIDEFPLFITRILKGPDYQITPERRLLTDIFTSWIRAITIKYKGTLRLVLSGSIGLEPILRQARLSSNINTFMPFEVNEWDDETASGCLYALANKYEVIFKDNTVKLLLDLLGCNIPQHVQMFFSYLYDDCKHRENMNVSLEDIRRIYKNNMLSVRGHAELSTLEERLIMGLGKDITPLAIDILTETAVTGELTATAIEILCSYSSLKNQELNDALREILSIFEHDGYLRRKENGNYVFISKLIRDWWKERFSSQFIPAIKRKV